MPAAGHLAGQSHLPGEHGFIKYFPQGSVVSWPGTVLLPGLCLVLSLLRDVAGVTGGLCCPSPAPPPRLRRVLWPWGTRGTRCGICPASERLLETQEAVDMFKAL